MRWASLLLCIGSTAFGAQPELTPELLLLARIKAHTKEDFRRLPNYTCVQTIERSQRRAGTRRFKPVDTVRLEVALAGLKELFAWPGPGKFQEREVTDFVPGGTVGDGNFGLHAYSVMLSRWPTYKYAGEPLLDGRQTVRFDYRMPFLTSGYRIRVPLAEATVGYHGSIWVDAQTLDLVRLEVHADDIPPKLRLSQATESIEYGRVAIGDSDFLLPVASELVTEDLLGNERRNKVEFSRCRKFTADSVLSFGEPPPILTAKSETGPAEIALPSGLSLELKLETPIDSDNSAVGDPVTALVGRDVKRNGAVLIPEGAVVFGRIVLLERISGRVSSFRCGLQFYSLEFEGKRAPFAGRMEDAAGLAMASGKRIPTVATTNSGHISGLGVIEANTLHLRLLPGYRMRWKTEAVPAGENHDRGRRF